MQPHAPSSVSGVDFLCLAPNRQERQRSVFVWNKWPFERYRVEASFSWMLLLLMVLLQTQRWNNDKKSGFQTNGATERKCTSRLKYDSKVWHHVYWTSQCDQIGRFFKVLGDKFTFKSYPNVWQLLGPIGKASLLSNTAMTTFWATFGKNWATLYFGIWSHYCR